eukprot:Skav210498  [mRNA]  locus=scaffold601:313154:323906:+ [translate_table: standard]
MTVVAQESMRYPHQNLRPWLNDDGEVVWSRARILLARVVHNQMFESFMGAVILANVALIVFETNRDASCFPDWIDDVGNCPHSSGKIGWVLVCNVALQMIYTAECGARGFADRTNFFKNRWNLLDLFIVIIGWVGMGLSELVNLNVLRIFRVIRLLRAGGTERARKGASKQLTVIGRLLIIVPELYILVSGLATSLKAVIVEKASQARQEDVAEKARQKLGCARDGGRQGEVGAKGMFRSFTERFALMTECGLEKTDIQTLFNAMDVDGSGEVDYVEFCAQLGALSAKGASLAAVGVMFEPYNCLVVLTVVNDGYEWFKNRG